MLKIISKYSKTGNLKYISHLDVLRFIQRAVKRAGIPAKYSEGFNPHMKTSFGFPLSLGNESVGEYFDLELIEEIEPKEFVKRMNNVLPKEMKILAAEYANTDESIMSRCRYVEYIINVEFESLDIDELKAYFEEMLSIGVVYERRKKNKKNKNVVKEINTKELIKYLNVRKTGDLTASIEAVFITAEDGSIKTDEFMKLLEGKGFNFTYYTIMKIDSLDKNMKEIL